MVELLTGLAMLAAIAMVFVAGWYLGRRAEIQRQVDAALRRETRILSVERWFDASPETRAATLLKYRRAPSDRGPEWPT